MATRMQQRRGTAEQWTNADPILAAGEIGFETDTNQFKIGDGVNAWSELSYFKNLEDLGGSLDDYVLVSTKGQANGVAELDNSGKIPSSQIPELVGLDSEISSAVSSAIADLVDGAPAALDTLNEIASTMGDKTNLVGTLISNLAELDVIANDLGEGLVSLGTTVTGHTTSISQNASEIEGVSTSLSAVEASVTSHISDTTNVHGIADTSLLATESYADDKAATAQSTAETNAAAEADTKIGTHNADTTNVHGIANTALLATSSDVSTAVSDHNLDTTNVHGIADTSVLVTQSTVDALTTADIAEDASNKYFTDARAISATSAAIATAKSEAIADATAQVSAVIASAPTALNTLDELAAALGDDANYAATITNSLAAKVDSYSTIQQKTASYTLSSLTEKDNVIEIASGSATTLTIPEDSAVNFPVGTTIDVIQTSTGQITVAAAGGVTVNATPGLKLRTQWSSATLLKRAANTWIVYGDLMA